MRDISNRFKNEQNNDNRNYLKYADITLADGTVINLTNTDFWSNGMKFEDSVSDDNTFNIGSANINTLNLSINNFDGKYTDYDFTDAKVICYVGIELEPEDTSALLDTTGDKILDTTGNEIIVHKNALIEKIRICTMTVIDTPYQNTTIIELECEDNMRKFDRNYSASKLKYPATRKKIIQDACKVCGVTLDTLNFYQDSYQVPARPDDEALTFRQVIAWVCQIGCQYARCDKYGRLTIKWYDTEITDANRVTIKSTNGFTPNLDDVVITGVQVTEYLESTSTDEEASSYLYGEEGYVLKISENKLIPQGTGQVVASMIGEKCVGMSFRPFETECLTDIVLEAGDAVLITDRKGNKYKSFLTNVVLQPGTFEQISCNAESAARNSSKTYSLVTQAAVDARKSVWRERAIREQALQEFKDRIDNSTGVYTTVQTQQDGSQIFYLHDKPTLAESKAVWKMTAEAWGVSTDGGQTWNGGMTVDGDTIVRILNAVGVNADWINAGAITVTDTDGSIIFSVDMDTKSVYLDGSVQIGGGKTLDETLEEFAASAKNMTIQLSNEYQGIPVDSDGNYSSFPECSTQVTVMYGSQDITSECAFTITKSGNVQGRWKDGTHTYTVTALTADSGWVDIRAAYLNNLVISKRFSLAKQYAGKNGINGLNGLQGEKGEQGIPGKDGKSSYFHIKYSSVAKPTSSSQMTETPSAYIGTYVDFTEADSNDPKKYTWSKFEGKDGEDGIPGTNGSDGKTYYLHIAYANSADGKTGFSTSNSTNKSYIGQYTDTTRSDSTDPTKYSWTKIKGETGAAGRTYFIELSTGAVKRGADGVISPASVTAHAYYRDGTGTRVAYSGRWKIQTSTNGSSWTNAYTGTSDTTSVTKTLAKADKYNFVRFVLYAAGGTTNTLDMQSFSILTDISSLTQLNIVDILSNNGEWDGLYYLGGKLYISFDAARGGLLALGGKNNGNGQLKIYDENGNEVLRLNNRGLAMNSADDDTITIIRLLRSGMYFFDSTGKKRKIALNTAGLALYTDYTDEDNYKALRFGKYGIYAVEKESGGVETLWMEGTDHTWDGYIIRYLSGKVRINANSIYTNGCSLGANFSTDGNATIGKDATVGGTLTFYDLENQSKTSGKVKRQPVASTSTDGSQVAYFSSGTGSPYGETMVYRRLGIRAQWGESGFNTDYLYTSGQVSDIRLKENIKNSKTDALKTVNRMKVRQFDWKKERGGWHQNIGFVADELEEIDPNLALGGGYDENGEMDVKQINVPYLLNYAVKAIQELSDIVKEQGCKIRELEEELDGIKGN